jgi:hypothetical protein
VSEINKRADHIEVENRIVVTKWMELEDIMLSKPASETRLCVNMFVIVELFCVTRGKRERKRE